MHVRKMFNNGRSWVKQFDCECSFDVTMGASDSTDNYNFIGLYILTNLGKKFHSALFDIHRDDNVVVCRGANDKPRTNVTSALGCMDSK